MNPLLAGAVFLTGVNLVVSTCVTTAFAEPAIKSPAGHFEFHVDPWISLHHFAYHFVRAEERDLKLRGRVSLTDADQGLSPVVRSACGSLLPAYRPYLEGSLLFDGNVRGLARMLTEGPDAVTDNAVRDALNACMPVYEKLFWPRHRAAGERLVEHLMSRLEIYETAMSAQFAESLDGAWPDAAIRVDVTPYANWAGAYTDDSPPNIVMSSLDEDISGTYSFEILFHESGHTASFEQSLRSAANGALESTGLESDRYWHYVLFFVAGQTTVDATEDSDYVPFAAVAGLTKSENAADYYQALEETWGAGGSFRERVLRAAQKVSKDRLTAK